MADNAQGKPRWACEGCDHMQSTRPVKSSNTTQYVCALNGHTYGNVKRCPYRECTR